MAGGDLGNKELGATGNGSTEGGAILDYRDYPPIAEHIDLVSLRIGITTLPVPKPGSPPKDDGSIQQIIKKLDTGNWKKTVYEDQLDKELFGDYIYKDREAAISFQECGGLPLIKCLTLNLLDGTLIRMLSFDYDLSGRLVGIKHQSSTFKIKYQSDDQDSPYKILSYIGDTYRP